MGLRDVLKKKSNLEGTESDPATVSRLAAPEFTFVRSDTYTQEVIHPPGGPAQKDDDAYLTAKDKDGGGKSHRISLDVFRSSRSRSTSVSSTKSQSGGGGGGGSGGSGKELDAPLRSASHRLSRRLHLSRNPASSEIVPQDLPAIVTHAPDGREDREGEESQWEQRATILARENEKHRSRPPTPAGGSGGAAAATTGAEAEFAQMRVGGAAAATTAGGTRGAPPGKPDTVVISTQAIDEDIREAIRLHEEGELNKSTAIFGRLADPKGANNTLSQVLYGLALRHGWGCDPDPAAAVNYLSAAASNAATVENLALQAGMKKGGAAKGELVLAIFELANCFRHGWGIPKDAVAAKQYYETAANLGDTDAMNEAAWCYLEGFGTKKDKYAAAKYYRLAEQNGNKTLGNSWIWKDKYNPENAKK